MAAATVNSSYNNVIGSRREKTFNVTIATTGDTLVTGFKKINGASVNNTTLITALAYTGGTVTFTGSAGTFDLRVVGY